MKEIVQTAVHFLGVILTVFAYWTQRGRKTSLVQLEEDLLEKLHSGIGA